MDFPGDADGNALRRLERDGSDMTRSMEIDFATTAPDEATGLSVAKLADAIGYRPNMACGKSSAWTCYCMRSMGGYVSNNHSVPKPNLIA